MLPPNTAHNWHATTRQGMVDFAYGSPAWLHVRLQIVGSTYLLSLLAILIKN